MFRITWMTLPALLALTVGCGPVDSDGDGYKTDEDCNDTLASVNPEAEETCNGIDDNCDGQVDESEGCSCATPADPVGGVFLAGLVGLLARRRRTR